MQHAFLRPGLVAAIATLSASSFARPDPPTYVGANMFLTFLAKRLATAAPADSDPLGLKVETILADNSVRLHCSLTNISRETIKVDRLKLPCAGWWSLQIVGVTTDARVLPKSLGVGSIISPLTPVMTTIEPGEAIDGDMPLQSVYPLNVNPRDKDVLLLWDYSYEGHVLTGIALLPRKS
jgi:hypothetical protein